MQRGTLILCLLLLPGVTFAFEKEEPKLEGTWEITAAEARGRKVMLKDLGMDEIVIRKDRLVFRGSGKEVKMYTLSLDTTKDPKEMDWSNKGTDTLQCIFEIKDGQLRIAFPVLEGKAKKITFPRPRTFNTIGKPVMVLTAKPSK